ncbi:MAG: transcription termination factor NusA [Thermodesulfobacteriota bacterium]
MISELKHVIDQISKDKGIDRAILIEALEEAIKSAAKKKYGQRRDLEVSFNEELGEMEVFQFREVVEKVTDEQTQISLEEGRKLDAGCQIGDSLGTKMDTSGFGRIAAQAAKQVIIQRMKDAEQDVIYDDFRNRKGEIVNGIVQRFEKGNVIINLGRTDAVLPVEEQISRENYRRGDRVRTVIIDVRKHSAKEPQVVLSRTHPLFLSRLFEMEVPEISESIVQIMGVAREPGSRSKIAVVSNDSDVDPVGACVGMRGSRVQNVVQELKGERIDIVPWNADIAKYVCNALAPAEVTRVIMDESNKSMEVVVADDQLSLAIGKQGQNVRLASRLVGWKIDVKGESKYAKMMHEGYQALIKIQGIGEGIADALFERGITSVDELSNVTVEELLQLEGMTEQQAQEIIRSAREYVSAHPAEEAVLKGEEGE